MMTFFVVPMVEPIQIVYYLMIVAVVVEKKKDETAVAEVSSSSLLLDYDDNSVDVVRVDVVVTSDDSDSDYY